MILNGMRVHVSVVACTYRQARVYARRRAKSKAHRARMNKKWLKRYGQKIIPQVFQVGNDLFVHPLLMPEIRALTKEMPGAN